MLSLKNKIVLVTGASSGIGKATAEQFAMQGAKVILAARRLERIEKQALELTENHQVETLALQLDVSNRQHVTGAIESLDDKWSAVDILVNNAGLALALDPFDAGDVDQWDTMIDTNLKGFLYVARAIAPGMRERSHGHIINIGSSSGREVYPGGGVYCATKHAVKALNKAMRLDLLGSSVRVSEVAPGMVDTEFSEVRFNDKQKADKVYEGFQALLADDVADAIIYCATRPLHVNVEELSVFPTAQVASGHVHKE